MRQQYQKELENRLVIPTLQFLHRERSSGIVLGIFVLLALVLANSPLRDTYTHFLEHHFGFSINGRNYLDFSLEHWINDGLMSMFFFVVGLELKREFIGGELRDLRKVTLPVVSALSGMLFPAVIYLIFNAATPTTHGWGIPMATDIAFALAVFQLLGNRVPVSAKVFLTTLAIIDDLGSVVIIALFYTTEISFASLAIGFVVLAVMLVGNRLGVKACGFMAFWVLVECGWPSSPRVFMPQYQLFWRPWLYLPMLVYPKQHSSHALRSLRDSLKTLRPMMCEHSNPNKWRYWHAYKPSRQRPLRHFNGSNMGFIPLLHLW